MDFIKKFDIELDKDTYYAGEKLTGHVIVQNIENLKVNGVRLLLRGRAHAEWKVTRAGERRTMKQDEYYIDEKRVVWGKDRNEEGAAQIMPRGRHRLPFQFQLPESALPCSFESKIGQIRYYLRVTIDIPYASPPQGIKYFTIVGPHIDCMEDRFLVPSHAEDKRNVCCWCCGTGPISVNATLDRSAYCCGENIKLKAEIQNGSEENVWLICRLIQYVEYFINKGVLGLSKEVSHKAWEFKGPTVVPHRTTRFDDLQSSLQVPIMPPTLSDVCSVIQIYYILKVNLGMEKSGEVLEINFPITIATIPFRIPNSPAPDLHYDIAGTSVEGGMYVSSEFQLGQVYMGDSDEKDSDEVILYKPVYVCIPHEKITVTNTNNAECIQSQEKQYTNTAKNKADNGNMDRKVTAVPSGREITAEKMTTV